MSMLQDQKTLQSIREELMAQKESIAVAESVTAGMLQLALSSFPDAMKVFQGGLTVYNLGQKTRQLSVDPIHAASCNCVSGTVAEQMAVSVARLFCCDWGIGITGYATPVPESDMQTYACYSIAYKGRNLLTRTVDGKGSEDEGNRRLFTQSVLSDLLLCFSLR